jgi:hypothetical protein
MNGRRTPIAGWAALAVVVLTGCETVQGGRVGDAGGTGTGSRTTAVPKIVLRNVMVERTGSGSGTVRSNPAGIACGAGQGPADVCGYLFPAGTAVTLTATPDASSTFGGWRGAGCTGTGVCRFTAGARVTVTATFVKRVAKPVRR